MKKSDIHSLPRFFDRYINLVEDIEVVEALKKYRSPVPEEEIQKLVNLADRRYAPGKWTVKDLLQHCIDNERILSYRALCFARNEQTSLPEFEEESYAQNTLASQRSVEDLLKEFTLVRDANIALFENFGEEMLRRTGVCNGVSISVLSLGFVLVGHTMHHLHVLRDRYYTLL